MAIEKMNGLSGLDKLQSLDGLGKSSNKGQKEFKITDFISEKITETNKELLDASQTSKEFLLEGKHDLHEVIIALEKADMSFRFMNTVRNRVLEAYGEVMRMPV